MVPDSRARHALDAAVDAVGGQTKFEEKYGVPQPQLSLLLTRNRLPGRRLALKLEAAGIRSAWWDVPPTARQVRTPVVGRARAS